MECMAHEEERECEGVGWAGDLLVCVCVCLLYVYKLSIFCSLYTSVVLDFKLLKRIFATISSGISLSFLRAQCF